MVIRLTAAVGLGLGLAWLAVGLAGHSPATCHLRGALPDRHCTPGVVRHLPAVEVCRRRPAPRVPAALAGLVYDSYGIRESSRVRYRIDELVPRQLGGLVASHNLWPEPVAGPPPASAKRALDARLQALVCSGRLRLRAAQRRVAANWIAADAAMSRRTARIP